MPVPTPAERARTVVRVATSVSVSTASGVNVVAEHHVDATGTPLLTVPGSSPLTGIGDDACVVHAVDVSPATVPDRRRGEVWLGGWLSGVPAEQGVAGLPSKERPGGLPSGERPGGLPDGAVLLRLDVAEVRLADRLFGDGRTVAIDPDVYATAHPDPLADGEWQWLGHLVTAHQDEFAQLCRLVPDHARPTGARIHPAALDRYGLLLRIDAPAGTPHMQVRLPFATPLDCPGQLPDAMTRLLHAAAAVPTEKGV
ncbi:MAG: DUF2470 domain-containing protein [Micromonosporaceae bacterium]